MDAEGESGDPDEYDAEEGSSPADPEENGTDGTGTSTDPGEDGTDSGEAFLDAGTEDESTGDGTEGADPGSDGADEPEDLSDGVSAAAEQNNAGRTVVVTSSLDGLDEVEENTEAVLTAVFYGFSDEDEYTIQWQYSPDGGATVYDAEDGTGPEYRYLVTEETIRYSWRVMVTLEAEEETLPEPAEDGALQE